MENQTSKKNNGFVPDEIDRRDYPWELFFGATTPEANKLPETFSWKNQMPAKLPIQGDEPACVSHCFACYQMFNSLKEGNKVELSPRFLYALTGVPNKGRTFRSNAKTLRDIGDILEKTFPNKTELSHAKYCDKSLITSEMKESAKKYRVKSWTVLNTDLDSLKRAISRGPVAIAVGGNNKDWKSANKDNIPFGKNDWFHAVLAIGWDKNKIEIANWWRSIPYGFLTSGYPVRAAYSLEDILDFPQEQEGWVADEYLKKHFIKGDVAYTTVKLNFRKKPFGEKIRLLDKGELLSILGAKQKVGKYIWQKVKVL